MTVDLDEPIRDEDTPKTPGAIALLAAKIAIGVLAGYGLEWSARLANAALARFGADLRKRAPVDPSKIIHVTVRTTPP